MGLKSGSRDSGLDEDDESDEENETRPRAKQTSDDETTDETDRQTSPASTAQSTGSDSEGVGSESVSDQSDTGSGGDGRPSMASIPYKLRRSRVNEGRDQVPFFLREEVVEGESELQDSLEELLGEDVYKSDYREAAMILAQRNPELVAEVLREWGYDLD